MQTPPIRAIFLDAAGTLFHLREPVGITYSRLASQHQVMAQPEKLEKAFRQAWKKLPAPCHDGPAADDDRSWWLSLVVETFQNATGGTLPNDVIPGLFDDLYEHFAKPEAWSLYPDTMTSLEKLHSRAPLFVLSNFDRRAHAILHGLNVARFFTDIILSSETGASKPHPRIFQRAREKAQAEPAHCLLIGDDPVCDAEGARDAGWQFFLLDRPVNTLEGAVSALGE